MPVFPEVPLNVRAVYKNDGSAKSAFLAEVDSMVGAAERRFREFSAEAQTQLDAALSVKRNSVGSLDLGVDQMRIAAAAQQARATAAREIAAATALAAKEEQDYSQKTRLAVAATEALAKEEEQAAAKALAHVAALEQVQERLNRTASATDMVVAAQRRGTTESGNVINGIRAQRVAFTQLGQQLQDVTVQAQMGTNATTIFVQQVPQMAFALSGLEGNANKFYSRIGSVATFLAGPWGAAIFAATAVMAPLIASLFNTGDAAEDAKGKTYDFSRGLDVLTLSANQTVSAMQQLQTEMRNAIAVQGDYLRSKALIAGQSANEIQGRLNANQAELANMDKGGGLLGAIFKPGGEGAIAFEMRRSKLKEQIALDQQAYNLARQAAGDSAIAAAQSRALENIDKRTAATGKYNRAVAELNDRLRASTSDPIGAQSSGKFISEADYQKQFQALTKQKDAELDALKKQPKGPDPVKAAKRLEDFGESAAEKIKRINERFDEQPRLIDAAAQSTRELDAIIKDLGERKPIGFQAMIADAQAAKGVIQEALLKPMQDLTRDSERRIQIQSLILSGYNAEANALRDIWQTEERNGALKDEQKAQILAQARAEEQVNEVLRQRQLIQQAYLDATQQIRSQLEALFSGDKVDFGRIFRQLRARIMVENIFGDVFRDMDKYIRKSTGVDQAVDQLRDQTTRASDLMGTFGDAMSGLIGRISGGGSGGGGIGSAITSGAGYKSGLESIYYDAVANTDAQFGAANDNGKEIVVAAITEGMKQGIKGSGSALALTPNEWAGMLSRNIGGRLAEELKPLLGTKLAGTLGKVFGGAAGGYATGGLPGGVIGALKGIEGLPKGISEALGKAGAGAEIGSTISGLSNALGLKMNTTGAQLGGAIGSVAGPIGSIVGSVAGGLLGNLFKSVKSGYAQVRNGVVAGTYGRTGDLQTQAAEAANGLIDQFKTIADKLGANLGKFGFDIGSKDGKFAFTPGAGPGAGVTQWYDKEADALSAALRSVVANGAFEGISDGVKRLISTGDIQTQLQKALDFQGVFKRLKQYTDPVGAALDDLNKEFTKLKATFAEAGASSAEYAQLEQLYGIERAKAIKTAMQQVSGSLQSLLDDLTVNNSALSLRTRESMAKAAFDPLAARVAAGDVTAFEDFSAASRTLLDVTRQIYGSQDQYFALNEQITNLTRATLDKQQAIADAATSRDSPFSGTTAVADNANVEAAVREQTDTLAAYLKAMNDNLGTLIGINGGSSNINLSSAVGYW